MLDVGVGTGLSLSDYSRSTRLCGVDISEGMLRKAKQRVREILKPLLDEMSNSTGGRCLGQIAEVYDAEPPHRPSGCPAQAWSVAEVLRCLEKTAIEQE